MPQATVNDINMYYEIHGEGDPLLLIAGLASDSQSWQFVINELSQHFKTIIFDNRGVGRSDSPSPPYQISTMADDAIGLLDHLEIPAAHILGHSMGGYIAQYIAVNYPERVFKLILESTAPASSKRNNTLFDNFYDSWKSNIDMEIWLKEFLFWIYSSKTIENGKFFKSIIQYTIDYPYPQSIEGFKGQIEAIKHFNLINELPKIHSETLVLTGEEDILIKPKETDLLYQGITRASYPVYVEKAAHALHAESPKAFINAVLGFLYKYVR